MLRIPSHREILGLFVKTHTVDGATKVLADTASRLIEVADHHCAKSDAKRVKAGKLRYRAVGLDHAATDHAHEARRAVVVQSKLNELLS